MESKAIYDTLGREIAPLFYERNANDLPERWIHKMKASVKMAGQMFSAQRMLIDYTEQFYVPAIAAGERLAGNGFELNRQLSGWLQGISASWDKIEITDIDLRDVGSTVNVGQHVGVEMKVRLGQIKPDDVSVEIVAGRLNSQEQFTDFGPVAAELNGDSGEKGVYSYHGEVVCGESGRFGITARVLPQNDLLLHNRRPKLISWW